MTAETNLSSSDITSSSYCKEANDAIGRGEFEHAKQICRDAVDQFERDGAERKASKAYHLLGEIAYRQVDLESADSWYRKALSIDERIGDDKHLGYARTCNNLGAVANARGEYDAAEEWLWKSIRIKESLGDERGIAASYHQLGVVAETRSDLETAEKWYLKSLAIEEELNCVPGMVKTMLSLSRVAGIQGRNDARSKWNQKALQVLDREGRSSTAISVGEDAELGGDYEAAKIVYQKAFDIAKRLKDDEGQSLSSLRLGHLACEMGEYASARDHYKRSIEIDERLHATGRAVSSCSSLGRLYLVGVNRGQRDFRTAKKWFRKSLALKQDASWRDFLSMYAYLWYHQLLSVLSK